MFTKGSPIKPHSHLPVSSTIARTSQFEPFAGLSLYRRLWDAPFKELYLAGTAFQADLEMMKLLVGAVSFK